MVGSAKEDSNRWCVPPRLQPRLVDGVLCLAVLGLIKYFVGLMFTAVLFGALVVLSPFYFIYRLIQRIIGHSDRAVDSSPQMTTRCDPWWPMGGTASEQMLLTVRSNVDVDLLNDNFGRAIAASKKNHNTCCWKRDIESPHESAKIVTWNQERTKLETVDDLWNMLNDPDSVLCSNKTYDVVFVPDFSSLYLDRSCCSVVIFFRHFPKLCVCLPRLLSLLSNGRLKFIIEPKPHEGLDNENPCSFTNIICYSLHILQLTCIGALSVVALLLRRRDSVWTKSTESSVPKLVKRQSGVNKKHSRCSSDSGSNASDGETALIEKTKDERILCWMRVPQCDQLMRVERFMRASSAEMMLAFVSGTLRRHFRSSGLAHPPDIGATIPVALRRSSDISADSECNSIMVPLRIPCGVEGTIPRLWAVQRRLAHAVNGVLPDALRVSRLLLDLFCSSKGDRLFFNKVYSDTSIVVSVLRMEGHLSFENQRIQSLLLFPSMPSTVKVAFTFVQCGSSTMLSVSADRLTFPNPELLLIHFKAEVNNFLEQLSLRLLTLSQATFLPFSVPCVNESEETDETVNKSRPTSEVTVNIGEGEEFDVEKCSIEQLRAHISKVQKELDDMKAESYCGPVDNEKKLKELESAMNAMHEKMAKLLGSPSYTVPRKNENDELTSNVVDELLAPYREEMGARTRRFSREFIRLDTPRLQPRRESAPPRANM